MTNIERFQRLLQRYVLVMEVLNANYYNDRNNKNPKLEERRKQESIIKDENKPLTERTAAKNKKKQLDIEIEQLNKKCPVNAFGGIAKKEELITIPTICIEGENVKFEVISGTGHNGGRIQKYISDLDTFSPFGTVCLTAGNQGEDYQTKKSNYLHWKLTGNNIVAVWDTSQQPQKISKLILSQNIDVTININDINSSPINTNLTVFFNNFCANTSYINLLKDRYNIVFTGAPGTGKTYLAKELAAYLTHQESYTKLDATKKEQIGFVQFHPSYDYTDFVEGLRPVKGNGQDIMFERQDGVFKAFCKKALTDWDNEKNKVLQTNPNLEGKNLEEAILKSGELKRYVFIIDEINRGELSKIFGELFYSIDPGYRGESGIVKTQYHNMLQAEVDKKNQEIDTLVATKIEELSNEPANTSCAQTLKVLADSLKQSTKNNTYNDPYAEGFFVPKNVYIIGTMNEIDRSVEPMDFAVRRRFVWVNVKPEDRTDMWDDPNNKWSETAQICMNNINKVIRAIETLGENYCIGPAYFNNPPLNNSNNIAKDDLWIIRIETLINEYLRVLPKSEAENYYKMIKAAFYKKEEIKKDTLEDIEKELKISQEEQ